MKITIEGVEVLVSDDACVKISNKSGRTRKVTVEQEVAKAKKGKK